MGSGASSTYLASELALPADASDVTTPAEAQAEVARLRTLLAHALSQGATAGVTGITGDDAAVGRTGSTGSTGSTGNASARPVKTLPPSTDDRLALERAALSEQTAAVTAIRNRAMAILEQALPQLQQAHRRIDDLHMVDTVQFKAHRRIDDLTAPTELASQAACTIFQVQRAVAKSMNQEVPVMEGYFETARSSLFRDMGRFLGDMMNYDKDNVPEKVIAELGLLVEDPLFTPEAMIAGSQERSGGGVEGGGKGEGKGKGAGKGKGKETGKEKGKGKEKRAGEKEQGAGDDGDATAAVGMRYHPPSSSQPHKTNGAGDENEEGEGGAAAEGPVRGEIAVCAAICGWARFIYAWHGVVKEAMPLQEQLALAEGKLAEKVSDVARLEAELAAELAADEGGEANAEASLDERYALLEQQLPDYSLARQGRWVLASRTRNIYHSDSTNPQSETNATTDLYDLFTFEDGTLFASVLHKSWTAWQGRGGSSGSIGSIHWDSEEVRAAMAGGSGEEKR